MWQRMFTTQGSDEDAFDETERIRVVGQNEQVKLRSVDTTHPLPRRAGEAMTSRAKTQSAARSVHWLRFDLAIIWHRIR